MKAVEVSRLKKSKHFEYLQKSCATCGFLDFPACPGRYEACPECEGRMWHPFFVDLAAHDLYKAAQLAIENCPGYSGTHSLLGECLFCAPLKKAIRKADGLE